jgi:hypothetical protein
MGTGVDSSEKRVAGISILIRPPTGCIIELHGGFLLSREISKGMS